MYAIFVKQNFLKNIDMGNMEIKNLDEARRIQEGVLNYYIGVICSGTLPAEQLATPDFL